MSLKSLTLALVAAQAVSAAPFEYAAKRHPLAAPKWEYKPAEKRDGCGPVSNYYNSTQQDWINAGTDAWLSSWIEQNQASFANHSGGFASAFGQWALGDPGLTCQDDGSSNCNVDASFCGNPIINGLGNETQYAYFVLKSMENLHAYFDGMSQSFQIASLLGALEQDSWVTTFYTQADGHSADDSTQKGITALKEVLNVLSTVVAVGLSFVTGPEWAIAKGVAGAVFSGAVGATNTAIGTANGQSDNFQQASDVGGAIGQVVQSSLTSLISNNNDLFSGKTIAYNNTNIQGYFTNGSFMDATVNEVGAIDTMGAMIQGMAINQLWHQNKIFIMGGGNCGDNQGIGEGPQNYSYCDTNNHAWYLYFWQANDVISTTSHQWGWVAMPPGADQLGSGMFPNVTVQDVIASSLDSYNVAQYNFTSQLLANRTEEAIVDGWANPMQQGPRFEGIFTIPVCDVSSAVNANYQDKQYILQNYGHDSRPVWCGPICNGDLGTTKAFINATGMNGFQSPKHLCSTDPGY